MNVTPAAPSAQAANGDRVRVLFADQLNVARGKYLPISEAHKGSARFCVGTYAVTYARQLVPAPGGHLLDGLPDMEAVFDPAQLRPCWDGRSQIALGDLRFRGEPFALCGRTALKRAISAWRELGYDPMVGIELEAYIFARGSGGEWVPYDTPGACVYGTGPFSDPAGLIDDIWDMAERCGYPVESINAEFDAPQFELTLRFADALKAADDIFLFRQMAREVLLLRGYLLCFMPKPIAKRSGSGMHVNLSLRAASRQNVFAARGAKGELPEIMERCIAGLLQHHEAMAGLLAPIENSYRRLQPASLSGYWANWGRDHRGVTVRVSEEGGAAARIEHRLGDCAASPYVAIATVLQAALLGVRGRYPLPPVETKDAIDNVSTQRHTPHSLALALDALAADTALTAAVGAGLVANYCAIKRVEIDELKDKTDAAIFDYYAPYI
jgi:glutamine synthetase